MRRLKMFLLLVTAVGAAAQAAAVKEDLAVTITGAPAKAMYDQLTAVADLRDYEDGLIPAAYLTRRGKQLSCTASTVLGPGGDWSYRCQLHLGDDGTVRP